ncbi:MAG TPA: hypothetical protein VMW83_05855 [Spirochaetia bacterium]|nr:hypothetical protein [Spirochaetia bacterium]
MSKIKMEVFLSIPPCSGGIQLSRLMEEIKAEFPDQLEITVHKGETARQAELKISSFPALVIGDLVRIMGLCPCRETLISGLRECGLG